jgi:glycosyltransferase involved in cell wall biosynthesis
MCLLALRRNPSLIYLAKRLVTVFNVPKILSAIDISILPGSTDIICPIKILEYMAAETAVILPDYPCNREVVTDNKNGLFFEPKNETALADKIELLLLKPELIHLFSNQARNTVVNKFSWEKTWGRVLDKWIENLNTNG